MRRWADHLKACTCGNLVYLRVLKCASSFFYNNLTENYKWESIPISSIDWAHQHVFGHIMDPVERRHKGVLEHLLTTGCLDLLESNRFFRDMIAHIPRLDEHSVSIHEMFGESAWLVDWIPISQNHAETVQQTEKLLRTTGMKRFDRWDYGHARPADQRMLAAAELLRRLWAAGNHHPQSTIAYLYRDQRLYNAVISNFNSFGDTWPDTSWLRDRK